ncbi:MAG: UbiD family decarboxylase [Calothrix sp. MO_192.B10]|nr:UbiD family decarboxylase [Calothrix sp. MO_192.B10]
MGIKRKFTIDRTKIPRSYREYIEILRDRGEAVEINDEVDWYLEMGAILRHASETVAPYPIFNHVKDSPGFRASELGPTCSRVPGKRWQRLALLLGLPDDATPVEMQDPLLDAKSEPSYPPVVVSCEQAPCKQNCWRGDEIDLNKLPAPLLHDGDKGRYLQTAGAIIVQSPEGEVPPDDALILGDRWTNWSISRGMIVNKNTMTGLWLPFQHNGMIYDMWKKQGKDCPFAIAFGVPPVAAVQLASAPPAWHDEYIYASALLGEGLEMVKCETSDLLVPASSEIVVEGFVSATQKSIEGPFGEFPGYLSDESHEEPTAHITCVTFRDNAILPICTPGIPIDSTLINGGFFIASNAVEILRQGGIPVIDGISPFEASSHWLVIRVPDSWHKITGLTVNDFIDKIANVFWTHHVGKTCAKLIVVGEDIPPDNIDKVVWALATRNNPVLGVYHYPQYDSEGTGLQVYLDVATKLRGRGGLVIYSCLPIQEQVGHPLEPVLSFETNYPQPVKQKIREKWAVWGFAEGRN